MTRTPAGGRLMSSGCFASCVAAATLCSVPAAMGWAGLPPLGEGAKKQLIELFGCLAWQQMGEQDLQSKDELGSRGAAVLWELWSKRSQRLTKLHHQTRASVLKTLASPGSLARQPRLLPCTDEDALPLS